jgi:hypothetical protein
MSEWLRTSGIKLVGKTGTAQVKKLAKNIAHVDAKDLPYKERDHAWFVAFSPYDNPEVVIVAMTEHGGFGGSTSGPVVGEVMKSWFTEVRGNGRYQNFAPLPPPKAPVVFVPKKKDEPTEETAPAPHDEETEADHAAHASPSEAAPPPPPVVEEPGSHPEQAPP